jgi:hypothetical protein
MYVKLFLSFLTSLDKNLAEEQEEPTLAQESCSLKQGGIVIKTAEIALLLVQWKFPFTARGSFLFKETKSDLKQ